MEANHLPDDIDEVVWGRPLGKMLPSEPKGEDVSPIGGERRWCRRSGHAAMMPGEAANG